MGDKYYNLHQRGNPKLTPEQIEERRKNRKNKKEVKTK